MMPLYYIDVSAAGVADTQSPPSWLGRMADKVRRFAAAMTPDLTESRKSASFNLVLAEYDDMISRICLGYSRTRAEYEDLRQDCYAAIWKGLSRFRGDSGLKTWLYRVVLNTCVSSLRIRSRTPERVDIADYADIIDDTPQRQEMIAEMHEMIANLPPLDKAIVTLWLEENSYDDIAEIVGMSRNTVATRLSRAKEKLKKIN